LVDCKEDAVATMGLRLTARRSVDAQGKHGDDGHDHDPPWTRAGQMIHHSGGSEGNHDGQRHPPVVTDDEVVPKREERKKLAHQSIPLTRSDIGDRGNWRTPPEQSHQRQCIERNGGNQNQKGDVLARPVRASAIPAQPLPEGIG
jgi:hypothetical protein